MNKYKYLKYVHKLQQLGFGLYCDAHINTTLIQNINRQYEYKLQFGLADGSVVKFAFDPTGNRILLGKGIFGEIYKGIYHKMNATNDTEIVIKEMDVRTVHSHIMFCEEITTMIEYNNPYAVKYYGFAFACGRYYIFMEFLHGKELHYFARNNLLTPEHKKYIAYHLIMGLKEMHRNGIAHRDIKLENIMLDIDNTNTIQSIKYIDFGFSCKKDINCDYSNVAKGTPAYIAPEIWKRTYETPPNVSNMFDDVFQFIDMWALGSTLFTLFTGSYLSESNHPQIIISSADDQYITNIIDKYKLLIPSEFVNVLLNLLKINPKERRMYTPEELAKM